MSTVTAQWGVKLTWPSGRTEIVAQDNRHQAESYLRHRRSQAFRPGDSAAELVVRAVTTTDWEATS